MSSYVYFLFLFTDTPPTEIYTLSLHDALPIFRPPLVRARVHGRRDGAAPRDDDETGSPRRRDPPRRRLRLHGDRKSTRLNSSHANISYAVFCLKKKTYDEAVSRHSTRRPTPRE